MNWQVLKKEWTWWSFDSAKAKQVQVNESMKYPLLEMLSKLVTLIQILMWNCNNLIPSIALHHTSFNDVTVWDTSNETNKTSIVWTLKMFHQWGVQEIVEVLDAMIGFQDNAIPKWAIDFNDDGDLDIATNDELVQQITTVKNWLWLFCFDLCHSESHDAG